MAAGAMAGGGGPPGGRFQGVDKASAGFRLLAAMGWKEGEGLGASKQGITTHVKVKKKHDASGVGAVEAAKRAKDWTLGTASFDEVLARLNSEASTAKPASCDLKEQLTVERKLKKRKKKSKTELVGKQVTEPSARDSMHAGALGPMGMEVDQDMSKSVSAALHASGGVVLCAAITAAARDSPDHSSEAVGGVPAVPASGASHLARFARRRAGKDVRSYSSQDMAAILGISDIYLPSVTSSPPGHGQQSQAAARKKTKTKKKELQMAASKNDIHNGSTSTNLVPATSCGDAGDDAGSVPGLQQIVASNAPEHIEGSRKRQWWQSLFVPGGRMGAGMSETQAPTLSAPQVRVHGFSEGDQETLYEAAQKAKGTGRRGLGVGDALKMAKSARWAGTRRRLDIADTEQTGTVDTALTEKQSLPEELSREQATPIVVPSRDAHPPAAGSSTVILVDNFNQLSKQEKPRRRRNKNKLDVCPERCCEASPSIAKKRRQKKQQSVPNLAVSD